MYKLLQNATLQLYQQNESAVSSSTGNDLWHMHHEICLGVWPGLPA